MFLLKNPGSCSKPSSPNGVPLAGPDDRHWYQVSNEALTFAAAPHYCSSEGLRLVKISTREQFEGLAATLGDPNIKK